MWHFLGIFFVVIRYSPWSDYFGVTAILQQLLHYRQHLCVHATFGLEEGLAGHHIFLESLQKRLHFHNEGFVPGRSSGGERYYRTENHSHKVIPWLRACRDGVSGNLYKIRG